MIEPLRLSFRVACRPAHAFATWTADTARWWPHGHTLSGERGVVVTFEPRVGGRIYERAPSGQEHDWGEITAWEPPTHLAYRWHIATTPDRATDVAITFAPLPDGATEITIVHGGFDRLGPDGPTWRDANQRGWSGLLPHYRAACDAAPAPTG